MKSSTVVIAGIILTAVGIVGFTDDGLLRKNWAGNAGAPATGPDGGALPDEASFGVVDRGSRGAAPEFRQVTQNTQPADARRSQATAPVVRQIGTALLRQQG